MDRNCLEAQSFKVVEDILFRQIENEGILLHVPSGTYYSLSETSIMFWNALSNQQPLEPIVDQIIDEYEVEQAQVLSDLQAFLQDLLAFGLITATTP
ncbi:MAG: PqqD family protein [Microcystaceae cyanobacterium]